MAGGFSLVSEHTHTSVLNVCYLEVKAVSHVCSQRSSLSPRSLITRVLVCCYGLANRTKLEYLVELKECVFIHVGYVVINAPSRGSVSRCFRWVSCLFPPPTDAVVSGRSPVFSASGSSGSAGCSWTQEWFIYLFPQESFLIWTLISNFHCFQGTLELEPILKKELTDSKTWKGNKLGYCHESDQKTS